MNALHDPLYAKLVEAQREARRDSFLAECERAKTRVDENLRDNRRAQYRMTACAVLHAERFAGRSTVFK